MTGDWRLATGDGPRATFGGELLRAGRSSTKAVMLGRPRRGALKFAGASPHHPLAGPRHRQVRRAADRVQSVVAIGRPVMSGLALGGASGVDSVVA